MIDLENLKKLLPKKVTLYYVDFGDDLSNHLSKVQECIHKGYTDSLDEVVYNWEADHFSYLEELKYKVEEKFGLLEEQANDILEYYDNELRNELDENDESDIIKDLFANTSRQTMFFDTGYCVREGSWRWSEKELKRERQDIKRHLRIKASDKTFDERLDLMIRQASYGGRLVIYFYDEMDKYIIPDDEKEKQISFSNFYLAIIDTAGGSGDHCKLNTTVKFPLVRENIFICKTFKYSYTHEVCMMSSSWCEDTKVEFLKAKTKRIIKPSLLNQEQDREKQLNETYKKGSCTAGDMDMSRHRNVTYINNFPCGNKCTDCNTFWID